MKSEAFKVRFVFKKGNFTFFVEIIEILLILEKNIELFTSLAGRGHLSNRLHISAEKHIFRPR